MRAAILIDDWKLSMFKKTLDAETYKYTEVKGPFPGCIILTVYTDDLIKLASIIKKINNDAVKSKMH